MEEGKKRARMVLCYHTCTYPSFFFFFFSSIFPPFLSFSAFHASHTSTKMWGSQNHQRACVGIEERWGRVVIASVAPPLLSYPRQLICRRAPPHFFARVYVCMYICNCMYFHCFFRSHFVLAAYCTRARVRAIYPHPLLVYSRWAARRGVSRWRWVRIKKEKN